MMIQSTDISAKCAFCMYAPCHMLVNRERWLQDLPKLKRNVRLDKIANKMVQYAVQNHDLETVQLLGNEQLQHILKRAQVAQIVRQGSSAKQIHKAIMKEEDGSAREVMFSEKFAEFGAATMRRFDGQIVMVQLFQE